MFARVKFAILVILFGGTVFAEYHVENLPNDWARVFPGGETTCARGEEFSFFYREGSSDDLIIDFVGGGACWNYTTCDKDTALFADSVDYLINRVTEKGFNGVYDHDNLENPLKEWTHVVIPYCTGDLHWGDSVTTYTNGDKNITIAHKGGINAKTVVDWTFGRYQPKRVFVTGTSAGGYASIYWLPYIKELAGTATTFQFSDSAAGIVVKEAFQEALLAWQVVKYAPTWIPSLHPDVVDFGEISMVDFYTEIGRHYPTVIFSQFNTNFDHTQIAFYYVMGGQDLMEWPTKALDAMQLTSTHLDNFKYFHASGEFHTILPEESFYTISAENTKLIDWLKAMIDQSTISNVVCSDCDVI